MIKLKDKNPDEDVQDSQGVSLKLKKIIRPKLAVQGIHHEECL